MRWVCARNTPPPPPPPTEVSTRVGQNQCKYSGFFTFHCKENNSHLTVPTSCHLTTLSPSQQTPLSHRWATLPTSRPSLNFYVANIQASALETDHKRSATNSLNIHPALVLRPGCVLEKVGVNKKRRTKIYSHQKLGVSVLGRSQPKGVKQQMRERKLEVF
jgi:hypothetical protein